jgi:hypothetical protein
LEKEAMAIIGPQERAVREITDRAEIADAIYRYAAGMAASDSLFYRRSIRLELARRSGSAHRKVPNHDVLDAR